MRDKCLVLLMIVLCVVITFELVTALFVFLRCNKLLLFVR